MIDAPPETPRRAPLVELRYFDRDRPAPVDAVVEMHRAHLPDSLVCRLGAFFMRRYFYSALVEAGLLFGIVAYVEGGLAGMVTGVAESNTFMRRGARVRPFAFATAMAGSALTNPLAFCGLLAESHQLYASMSRAEIEPGVGEIPTCIVLPEYVNKEFQARLGAPMVVYLTAKILEVFLERGATHIRALVKPDNGRILSRMADGGWVRRSDRAPGWRNELLEMRLDIKERLPYHRAIIQAVEGER